MHGRKNGSEAQPEWGTLLVDYLSAEVQRAHNVRQKKEVFEAPAPDQMLVFSDSEKGTPKKATKKARKELRAGMDTRKMLENSRQSKRP